MTAESAAISAPLVGVIAGGVFTVIAGLIAACVALFISIYRTKSDRKADRVVLDREKLEQLYVLTHKILMSIEQTSSLMLQFPGEPTDAPGENWTAVNEYLSTTEMITSLYFRELREKQVDFYLEIEKINSSMSLMASFWKHRLVKDNDAAGGGGDVDVEKIEEIQDHSDTICRQYLAAISEYADKHMHLT